MPRLNVLACMLALFVSGCSARLSALDLPGAVNLGAAQSGDVLPFAVSLVNSAEFPASVVVTSACECVVFEEGSVTVPPGGTVDVKGRFDTAGYDGQTEKILIFEYSTEKGSPARGYTVLQADLSGGGQPAGPCPTCAEIEHLRRMEMLRGGRTSAGTPSEAVSPDTVRTLRGEIFYSTGCRECEELVRRTVPDIEKTYGARISLQIFNLMDPAGFRHMSAELERLGIAAAGAFPLLIMDGSVFRGKAEITEALRDAAAGEGRTRPAAAEVPDVLVNTPLRPAASAAAKIAALPVFLAGLADGINPCAFSTLFFLLSVLTQLGRTRRQIAVTGAVFAGTVFLTYLSIGFGLFAALRALGSFGAAAEIIRWVLFSALAVFSLLSFYDAFLASKGRLNAMVLQLPLAVKQRIHRTIREKSRTAAIIGGTIVTGFLVSVFELACTGQIYLPAVTYMTRIGENRGAVLLLVYNVGFILPLISLFIMVYAGISSRKAAALFKENLLTVKIVLGLVFAVFAFLTVIT